MPKIFHFLPTIHCFVFSFPRTKYVSTTVVQYLFTNYWNRVYLATVYASRNCRWNQSPCRIATYVTFETEGSEQISINLSVSIYPVVFVQFTHKCIRRGMHYSYWGPLYEKGGTGSCDQEFEWRETAQGLFRSGVAASPTIVNRRLLRKWPTDLGSFASGWSNLHRNIEAQVVNPGWRAAA